jgi:hypothetical protein
VADAAFTDIQLLELLDGKNIFYVSISSAGFWARECEGVAAGSCLSVAALLASTGLEIVMATHKTKLAADRRRIDVHEAYELGYWSRKFGVTREELANADQRVGTRADDVARELRR